MKEREAFERIVREQLDRRIREGDLEDLGGGRYRLTPRGRERALRLLREDPAMTRSFLIAIYHDFAPANRLLVHDLGARFLVDFAHSVPEFSWLPEGWAHLVLGTVVLDPEGYRLAVGLLMDYASDDECAVHLGSVIADRYIPYVEAVEALGRGEDP